MILTADDLAIFQAQHPNHRLELVRGKVVVMSPSSVEADEVAAEVARPLGHWVRPRKLRRVTASSAGFRLSNRDRDVRPPRPPLPAPAVCAAVLAPLPTWPPI